MTDVQFDSASSNRATSNIQYTGSGQVQFTNYTGTMSSANFESDNGTDPYGRVLWDFSQTEIVNNETQTFGNDAIITTSDNLGEVTVELIDDTLSIAPESR